MFYLIDVDSGDGDSETASVIGRIADEGDVEISSPHWLLSARIVGKATDAGYVKPPGCTTTTYTVEPLGA